MPAPLCRRCPTSTPPDSSWPRLTLLSLPRGASATVLHMTDGGLLLALLTSNAVGEPWGWLLLPCIILGIDTLLVLLLASFLLGFGSGRSCLGVCARRYSRAMGAFFSPEIKVSSTGRRHVGTMGHVHYMRYNSHRKHQADTYGFRRAWEVTVDA